MKPALVSARPACTGAGQCEARQSEMGPGSSSDTFMIRLIASKSLLSSKVQSMMNQHDTRESIKR